MTTAEATLTLSTIDGEAVGTMVIRCLPGRERSGNFDLIDVESEETSSAVVIRLLEDHDYRYEIHLHSGDLRELEPQELFNPDDPSRLRGRLQAGLHTGNITARVETDSHVAFGDFEVRSRKLDYVTDYQAMLTSIATQSAELLMQRFSPSRITAFTPTGDDTAETLYQRFAFLESMLSNGHFKSAVAMLLHRPHENYENEQEVRLVGRGLKGGSSVGRQFARGGPRTTSAIAVSDDVRRMVPRRLLSDVFEPTFDSEPNRFVKMAFEYWRAICVELMDAMSKSAITSATRRGLLDAQRVVDDLDEVLSHPMFREVGPLTHMPIANQVLQRREGYRDVANLFVLTEAAAQLQWQGGEHVFGAGQRNVAELYEYWCYLQLRRIVETFAKHDVESHDLFEVSKDRVTLGLRRGRAKVFRGSLVRRGRKIGIELWFNKSFSKNESWSKTMRPDCSIRIIADSPLGQTPPDVWLHFDAKY